MTFLVHLVNLIVYLTTQLRIGLIITLFKAVNLQKIHEGLLNHYAIEQHQKVNG